MGDARKPNLLAPEYSFIKVKRGKYFNPTVSCDLTFPDYLFSKTLGSGKNDTGAKFLLQVAQIYLLNKFKQGGRGGAFIL